MLLKDCMTSLILLGWQLEGGTIDHVRVLAFDVSCNATPSIFMSSYSGQAQKFPKYRSTSGWSCHGALGSVSLVFWLDVVIDSIGRMVS